MTKTPHLKTVQRNVLSRNLPDGFTIFNTDTQQHEEWRDGVWHSSNQDPQAVIDNTLAVADLQNQFATVVSATGQYSGKGNTFASLPTQDILGAATAEGDWVILTVDDVGSGVSNAPQYPAGIYVQNAAGTMELLQENHDLVDVLLTIIATEAEVTAGIRGDKVASVASLAAQYAKLEGSTLVVFNSAPAEKLSTEVTIASQFAGPVTVQNAQTDWASLV